MQEVFDHTPISGMYCFDCNCVYAHDLCSCPKCLCADASVYVFQGPYLKPIGWTVELYWPYNRFDESSVYILSGTATTLN